MLEVALFPIPDLVAFPGTVVPLHVFEPRYRQLVHDCVEHNRMIAVSDVVKTIHEPKKQQTIEQTLSSNQATYKPCEVFSAGTCEVLETTQDGRIIAAITMSKRLRLVEDVQSLPYRIVACTLIEDAEDPNASEENLYLQGLINQRLVDIIGKQNSELATQFQQPEWQSLEPAEFSFKMFQFLRFDADTMQTILEDTSANARLKTIWDVLRFAQ